MADKKLEQAAKYTSPYGKWEVTTEGDCEGRSTRNLGTFEGWIDEIAFALASKCYYSLHFSPAPELKENVIEPRFTTVNISLGIDSGTWDLHGPERVEWFRRFFKGRNIEVVDGIYYASVTISLPMKEATEIERKNALGKLTQHERELLGLTQ